MKKLSINLLLLFCGSYAAAAFFYLATKQHNGADLLGCLLFGSIVSGLTIRRAAATARLAWSMLRRESTAFAERIAYRRENIRQLEEDRAASRLEKNYVFSEK